MSASTPKKLIEMQREYLILMMEAGYVYLTLRRLEEAREVFEGVSHLTPKSEVPHIGLGNTYAVENKYDQAIREFKKALKLEPNSALAQAHLGEIYLLQDLKSEGLAALDRALAMDPDGKAGDFARSLKEAVDKGVLPLPKAPLPTT